ncbi:hypothetical protein APHAL10511_000065 [Amanita phalloides]|nr:hypothetical protein APHAL10511_000065 [Amanita phalloides]
MSLNQDLLDGLRADMLLPETEETWDRIANGIDILMNLCRNGACDFPHELIPALKSLSHPLINALNSERTRLSGPAIELVATVASGLGSDFDPLLSLLFPPLLLLCSRSNKVVVGRAKACVLTIVQSTQLPSILPHLLQHSKDKMASLRLVVAEGTLACLNCFNPPDLEKEPRARDIESLIRITAKDAAADIRKVSRDIFKAYSVLLPSRVKSFVAPLSPTTKKYLEIKLSMDPDVPNDRRHLNLAASTSSLVSAHPTRCPESMVPERPKSSFSYRTDDSKYIKKFKSNTQLLLSAQNHLAPVVSQEARRLPVSAAERLPITHAPSTRVMRPVTAKIGGFIAEEPRRIEVSTGPKRIPMPEAPSTSLPTDVTTTSEPLGFQKPLKLLKSDTKPIKPTRDDNTKNRSFHSTSSRPLTQRGVSQATQPQRTKTIVDSKPSVIQRRKQAIPKTAGRKAMSRQPNQALAETKAARPPLQGTTQKSSDLLVNSELQDAVVRGTEQNQNLVLGEEETAQTKLAPECETPKKTMSRVEDKTPISALVSSIQQDFLLFTPSSPPPPPQPYLNLGTVIPSVPFPLRLRQRDVATNSIQLRTTDMKDHE